MKMTKLKIGLFVAGLAAAYAGSYVWVSLRGAYSEQLYASGEVRYASFHLALMDVQVWEPGGIEGYPKPHGFWGTFYAPLIAADRRWWHPHVRIITLPSEQK